MGQLSLKINLPRTDPDQPLAEVTIDASPAEIIQAMSVGQALISKLKNVIHIRNGKMSDSP